ncbi:hypothetical protein ACET3Z_021447 [Daucus carota]
MILDSINSKSHRFRSSLTQLLYPRGMMTLRSLTAGYRLSLLPVVLLKFWEPGGNINILPCCFMLPLSSSSFSLFPSWLMDYVWQNPEADHVKINVHCITLPQPLPNGNSVGVGAVVRNQRGKDLWSAAGPMNGKTKLQATLWGIYHGALHCHQIKEWKTQIETDHWGAYEAIRFQEEFQQEDDITEVIQLFNTLHSNNFQIDTTERSITRIPVGQNSTAVYLARYGLENMKVFAETPGSFGEKQFWLERDMGLLYSSVPPANFGMGEVIDADEPVAAAEGVLNRENTDVEQAELAKWSLLSLPKRVGKAIYAWF